MESKNLDAALAAKNTATDGAYIMAQDASGNTIRIAKADLASVLAGLGYKAISSSTDLNDIIQDGIYTGYSTYTNQPSDITIARMTIMQVLTSSYVVYQFAFFEPYLYFRSKRKQSNEWVEWKKLNYTTV